MDPQVVVAALVKEFGTSCRDPNLEEEGMIRHIRSLLTDQEIVAEVRTLGFDDADESEEWDKDQDYGDDEEKEGGQMISQSSSSTAPSEYIPSPKEKKLFPGNMTDDAWQLYKERAYKYWKYKSDGSPRAKNLKLATVRNQFRFINSLQVLCKYEKKIELEKPTMKAINNAVLNIFIEKEAAGAVIHDRTLRMWALQMARDIDPEETLGFCASPSWVLRFKKRNAIVNRAITHKVSRNWKEKDANLIELADEFIVSVRQLIKNGNYGEMQVFNADQSRFEKELHGHRTLRSKGTTVVRTVVGSVSATTHSYMIMPVISMSGEIMRPMYVLVSEPTGKFPASKPADPANIISFAGKTANMSKTDLEIFYQQVFWPSIPGDRGKILLLLDSWSANKDDVLSDSVKPEGKEFEKTLIPGGCTGKIQPLDVGFFRQYKSFIRFITDTLIFESEEQIWHRDRFLALQAFAIYQFSAPKFKNMVKYAFFKSGYLESEPGPWISPHEFCFDSVNQDECSKCDSIAFIKCAHCEQCICANHAILDELHIDCTVLTL